MLTRCLGILSENDLEIISSKTILIIGVGGVGGSLFEILVRSGFKNFILIDPDIYDSTNLNRQLGSNKFNIGSLKVEELKKRGLAITDLDIMVIPEKVCIDHLENLNYDFVADAIDEIGSKIKLLTYLSENKVPHISSMGMAKRLRPDKLKITPLNKTHTDPLSRVLRSKVDKSLQKNITVVFSEEVPVKCENLSSMILTPLAASNMMAFYIITYFT